MEFAYPPGGEGAAKIAKNVAKLLADGDCLHIEVVNDAVIPLIERKVITGAPIPPAARTHGLL